MGGGKRDRMRMHMRFDYNKSSPFCHVRIDVFLQGMLLDHTYSFTTSDLSSLKEMLQVNRFRFQRCSRLSHMLMHQIITVQLIQLGKLMNIKKKENALPRGKISNEKWKIDFNLQINRLIILMQSLSYFSFFAKNKNWGQLRFLIDQIYLAA